MRLHVPTAVPKTLEEKQKGTCEFTTWRIRKTKAADLKVNFRAKPCVRILYSRLKNWFTERKSCKNEFRVRKSAAGQGLLLF
jgi:hypothetical protein